MGGDSLESATNAFLAELTDFFPDPQRRAAFAKFLEKNRQIVDIMREMGMQELESLDPASVARQLSSSSGKPPASSESIPARSA